MESIPEARTFIVRVSRDGAGRVAGVVQRVRTGAKEPFHGIEAISSVIARMVDQDDQDRVPGG